MLFCRPSRRSATASGRGPSYGARGREPLRRLHVVISTRAHSERFPHCAFASYALGEESCSVVDDWRSAPLRPQLRGGARLIGSSPCGPRADRGARLAAASRRLLLSRRCATRAVCFALQHVVRSPTLSAGTAELSGLQQRAREAEGGLLSLRDPLPLCRPQLCSLARYPCESMTTRHLTRARECGSVEVSRRRPTRRLAPPPAQFWASVGYRRYSLTSFS